jgi:adenylate kinase
MAQANLIEFGNPKKPVMFTAQAVAAQCTAVAMSEAQWLHRYHSTEGYQQYLASFQRNIMTYTPFEAQETTFVDIDGDGHVGLPFTQRRMIIAGPPAGGKGSLAEGLLKRFPGIQHLSTGDMLRAARDAETPAGLQAGQAMKAGRLVSDDIVIGCVQEALTRPQVLRHGFMLDGFPRSFAQAVALDEILEQTEALGPIQKLIVLEVSDEDLKVRVCGRMIHKTSGRSYHTTFKPPKIKGKDDVTGETLTRRSDDTEEALTQRIASYNAQTLSVVEHYGASDGVVVHAISDNRRPPSAVLEYVKGQLEQF